MAPVLELETGVRSGIAVAVGVLALVLSPLGLWSKTARGSLAVLGLFLALVCFALPGTIGATADLATCSVALIMAGVAPWPVVVLAPAAVPRATAAPSRNEMAVAVSAMRLAA